MSPGECIIHDNGGEFNNGFLKKLAKEMNVDLRMTTGGRPWANGQAEAAVKLLKNKIKMIALDTTESNSIVFFWKGQKIKNIITILRRRFSKRMGWCHSSECFTNAAL